MQQGGWMPQEEATAKICGLFSEYQHPGSNQSQVLAQLDRCRAFPDFNNYLALILAQGNSLQLEIRQSAGLLLKNNLKVQYVGTPPNFQEYIKASLLLAIDNDSRALRHVVGTNIATIVAAEGITAWPQLLPALAGCLESDSVPATEGALDALFKVFEDTAAAADGKPPAINEQLGSAVAPRVLALFCSPSADIKRSAIGLMNAIVVAAPASLSSIMETYRLGLFSLARDPATGVRRAVCAGLVQLLHLQPEALLPQMPEIIDYMLKTSQDEDEALALEACEFWAAFCETPLDTGLLAPSLPRLVPMLLKNMVYDEFDEEVVDTEAAEAGIASAADHDADVRPFHHRNNDGEGGGKDSACWNLRKCSAAGLDVLSTVFAEELLPYITPTVRQRLQDEDWRARESAILALGAISEGCHRGLVPYIGELVGLLIPCLGDARPLVRSITCWTLSRYSHWVVASGQDPHSAGQRQFDLVIEGLLGRVLDHNKHVQEAACSALATLEEQAGPELLPRLKAILETLAHATRIYGRRNVRMLYDALSTLAEAVGRALSEPSFLQLLMPTLVAKWQSLNDTDRELLPLLECLMTIATAIGPAFEEYAETTFQRCVRILGARLMGRQVAAKESDDPEADLDLIVCSLDMLSGIAEALGYRFEALLGRIGGSLPLRDILLQCCQDTSPDIRQSAFALVGDLAKVCAPYLVAALTELVALSIANLEAPAISAATMSACNNACWSLGELAITQRAEDLAPFAAPIAERLVPILGAAGAGAMPRSLVENAAITLGRVAWVCPGQVAPHLEHFLAPWCGALRLLNDGVEKEHAFQGLCSAVRHNPQAAAGAFKSIVEAVLSWQRLHNEGLAADIMQILQLHKAELLERGQWPSSLARLSPLVRDFHLSQKNPNLNSHLFRRWQPYLASLSPAVRDKMLAMLQHT